MELTLAFALGLIIIIGVKFKSSHSSNEKRKRLEKDLLSIPPQELDKLLKKYEK